MNVDRTGLRVYRARRAWRYVAPALIMLALWCALLERRALWEPDEARYAEIPREMVATGDWTTPRLNDLLYFEKPPLQYWATATAYTLFGQRHWTARLWIALTGLAGALLVLHAGRKLYSPTAGAAAAVILASSLLYFGMGHINTLDMGLALFTSITVLALALGLRDDAGEKERAVSVYAAWGAAGLAVLSKGLVGIVLPAGALVGYSLLYRDASVWKKLSPLRGAALLLAVSAPWFIAVSRANPDFAQFFFIHEHFTRFTTHEHHRVQPWFFFVPALLAGTLPWIVPMIAGWMRGLRRDAGTRFQPSAFLAIWALVVFVFFSASGSKLVPYILPMFPALALLAGRYVCEANPARIGRALLASSLIPAALLALAPVVLSRYPQLIDSAGSRSVTVYALSAAALWAAGGVLALMMARRGDVLLGVFLLAPAAMAAYQVLLLAAPVLAPAKSTLELAQKIRPHLTGETRLYTTDTYPQSLPFYLGRTVTVVHVRGELDFGLTHEPDKTIPTIEAFRDVWPRERDAVAVMTRATYRELAGSGLPMTVIAEDVARVAVRP
ncbi:MAG TPA: glycosyltransferase family 39 protein [Burkholderiales bacterium]|nr:glycosyltransferase family 39 protein [Burkholderiales bacterium]